MTKNGIIFGLVGGGTVGLFVPAILAGEFGIINFVTAVIGAVLGLIGVGIYVHYYGRIR